MLPNKRLQNEEQLIGSPSIARAPNLREDESCKLSKQAKDTLGDAVRAYRELRNKNSLMWRNFNRLPPPELTQ